MIDSHCGIREVGTWHMDAWEKFVFHEIIDQRVRPEIIDSWLRCKELSVDPLSRKVLKLLSPLEFSVIKEKRRHLIRIALPYIKLLSEYAINSGFTIFLADSQGTVLILDGDLEELQKQKKINLLEGAIWTEQWAGTNAVGTSIYTRNPLQVVGEEHYCASQHSITCSGAPICDSGGNLIGVLNMSGNCQDVSEHTLGMVVACAKAIQNQVKIEEAMMELEKSNSMMNTTLECIPNAIITVDKDSIITQINSSGEKLLNIERNRAIGNSLSKILPSKEGLIHLMRNGSANGVEVFLGNDKAPIRCNLSTSSVYNQQGQYNGAVLQIQNPKQVDSLVNQITGAHAEFSFDTLIGKDKAFIQAQKIAHDVAKTNSTVLLLGESGTGKELFAHAIHNASKRQGAFIAVNCSAIPRSLIESELFGYDAGSFTGANRSGRPGKFERAHYGTILLDEIGDMPLDLQAVLLRVLQEREVVRVGGYKPIAVDVRVIASTNKNLLKKISEGSFREDLYYRLNVITIKIPPLRERKNDIPLLVETLLPHISRRMNTDLASISPAAMQVLQNYDWPGNVRELENVLERSVAVAKSSVIDKTDLSDHLNDVTVHKDLNVAMSLQEMEKMNIQQVIDNQRTMADVAVALGISKSTLYRKLKELNLSRASKNKNILSKV